MKRHLLALFLVFVSVAHTFAGARIAAVSSPEVHADRTVTFRIVAPKATVVTLTGDWVDGAQKLTNTDGTNWSVTLGPLPPSTYIYSFNVDGVPTADPINPRIKLRARGSASLVEVLADKPSLQEVRDVPHGAVEVNWQKSSIFGETRPVLVYTPPGYTKGTSNRYPVLLLLHGSNDKADGWVSVGNLNFIADNLIAEKKMKPMVIVMPNFYFPSSVPSGGGGGGGGGRGGGGAGNNTNNTAFYKYLLEEVLPMIESKYRIASGRKNHAVAGMSMGANQSLDLFFNHFDIFSSVGALCPSAYRNFETNQAPFLANAKGNNPKIGVLWIGCGRQDPGHWNGSLDAAKVLEDHQINHIWHPTEGMHNYAIWRDYLVEFLPMLFQPATR